MIRVYSLLLLAIGLVLVGGGMRLISLHGSSYYLFCGAALTGSAVLLWFRRGEGIALYGLAFCKTADEGGTWS